MVQDPLLPPSQIKRLTFLLKRCPKFRSGIFIMGYTIM